MPGKRKERKKNRKEKERKGKEDLVNYNKGVLWFSASSYIKLPDGAFLKSADVNFQKFSHSVWMLWTLLLLLLKNDSHTLVSGQIFTHFTRYPSLLTTCFIIWVCFVFCFCKAAFGCILCMKDAFQQSSAAPDPHLYYVFYCLTPSFYSESNVFNNVKVSKHEASTVSWLPNLKQ